MGAHHDPRNHEQGRRPVFTLVYEGELRANDAPRRKWEIRKYIHPQLQELWDTNPTLMHVKRHRLIPKSGYYLIEGHHSLDDQLVSSIARPGEPSTTDIDLCDPIAVGGRQFWPLVRESFALTCTLRILFLRKEEPGKVYQGGDLDNRLKTLFDSLSAPNADQIVADATISDPIHCLLENDRLITRIDIDTHRLLAAQSNSKHEVKLIIEVDVRVAQSRTYNHPFLGD
jgi:hypothetical protein